MSSTDLIMGAAGASGAPATYVDDVFSTYLYTGNGASQTITNGIDLSGKGGLVWVKPRSAGFHNLYDTARGTNSIIYSNTTDAAESKSPPPLSSYNSNGFTLDGYSGGNTSATNYTSWTFRKAPKFFDVVTYTGTGSARTIAHNLGSVPGMIIVKQTNAAEDWYVYHRSLSANEFIRLNTTGAKQTSTTLWNNTSPTSSVFSVGSLVNTSGATYVAYLFAHDAGGFGAAGTDNVISCGSYTGNGSTTGPEINLGYEPQYLLVKNASSAYNWVLFDVMRGGFGAPSSSVYSANLYPNTSDAEINGFSVGITATGFKITDTASQVNANGSTYIYMAIRRPMKPPTSGTEVFEPLAYSGNSTAGRSLTNSGFVPDLLWSKCRSFPYNWVSHDRLRGSRTIYPNLTNAEGATTMVSSFGQNNVVVGTSGSINESGQTYSGQMFRRAPGFFDVVCYTGTGYTTTNNVTHNLGVTPELYIVKNRNSSGENWFVWHSLLNATSGEYLILNGTNAKGTFAALWGGSPTATTFAVKGDSGVNFSGSTYVAYLFATVAGVSKVGSYTGTGTTQTINCAFTTGARFVLIKRTDSTGDWYVWDSARGIIAGNDPYLLLNSTATEVTNTDYIDAAASGFEISSTAPAAINANGGSFIFLAIA